MCNVQLYQIMAHFTVKVNVQLLNLVHFFGNGTKTTDLSGC